MINHKRQDYSAIKGGTSVSGALATSEYAAQIVATDHSNAGGLSLDLRAPYSIHLRVISKKPFDSLNISNVILRLGERQQVVVTRNHPVQSRSSKNDYGLYIATINLPNSFDFSPRDPKDLLSVEVQGEISRQGSNLSFRAKSRFVFTESRLLRLFTLGDAISI
jgi:hypothetical protein